MAEDMETIVLEILKRIQTDVADLRRDMANGFSVVESRLDTVDKTMTTVESRLGAVEDSLRLQRRDTAGLLVIAKSAVGDLALQIEAVERRTTALEGAS